MNDFIESGFGFRLEDPWMLTLLVFMPGWFLWRRKHASPSVVFASGAFIDKVFEKSWRRTLSHLPRSLQFLGMILVIIALARPVERDPLPLTSRGIDIVLCIDSSSSMTSLDMDPEKTRLQVAKDAAIQFVENRSSDRTGLVSFARYPDLKCPPTLDHPALAWLISAMEPQSSDSPEDATGIGAAVARSAQILKESPADAKVIVLLTDGEENVASTLSPLEIAPVHAAQLCKELGIRVYTIVAGIGRNDRDRGWIPLDTTQVRSLAEETDGAFFEAKDAQAVQRIYETIDALERVAFEEPRFLVKDRFFPWLVVAVSLLLMGRFFELSLLGTLP